MLIPFIPKNPELSDLNCRDGEIDFLLTLKEGSWVPAEFGKYGAETAAVKMTALHDASLTQNIRIPLQPGDRSKAELLLSGEISRVDPETADRLTQAIVQKAAQCLLDISTDLRRQGLFILPFRFHTMLQTPDGALSYPSPQGVALPVDFPPHPEITAAAATDDCLTLAIRFPATPHRLTVTPPADLPEGYLTRTFISYPLYIPDPKEMRGSLGSVRSATGGTATGIRFAFLSTSALKASVAAPEKYYELVGNERTGYRFSSKAAAAPDYSCYADIPGRVLPFQRGSLLALGDGVAADTDPMDWIADWIEADCATAAAEGPRYLPAALPHKFWHSADTSDQSDTSDTSVFWPEGIDGAALLEMAQEQGMKRVLLTRPMALADAEASRRHATPRAIRTLRVLGLDTASPALAILYGSDDGVRWTPLRRFDPRRRTLLLAPPRHFWRLGILYCDKSGAEAVFLE